MKSPDRIPYYSPDGSSLGFRSLEIARRLVAGGHVKPAWGRKGHLKAIWLSEEDGGNPVEGQAPTGTRYIFYEKLPTGHHAYKHRRVDVRDETGKRVSMRPAFLQVVADCTRP
jgi:hypothetical protein